MTRQASMTRRTFLRGTASAAAIPYVITSSSLGAKDKLPASERLVMGAIGCGGQGMRHVGGGIWVQGGGFLSKPGVQVVAVSDVNRNNLNDAKKTVDQYYGNGDCTAYPDYRQLLARRDIDIILCAAGDRWHTPVSIAAERTSS